MTHDFAALELGESIAVNGVCLTAATCLPQKFEADASAESVSRTNLGELVVGCSVHLERALRVGDRFGGHIVAGHVDSVTNLLEMTQCSEALELVFELPIHLVAFITEKGSVAIDGVSLTVNRITAKSFSVMAVPHTLRATHLGSLRRGDGANLEVDVLARYVVHLAHMPPVDVPNRDATLRQALTRAGLL